jgi:hypothetical protein
MTLGAGLRDGWFVLRSDGEPTGLDDPLDKSATDKSEKLLPSAISHSESAEPSSLSCVLTPLGATVSVGAESFRSLSQSTPLKKEWFFNLSKP